MFGDTLWLWIGFGGQAIFFGRFFIQWLASERRKQSVIPPAFWFLSVAGGLILLTYAIHRRDPVFIAGQSTGLFIYGRNLWFIYRPRVEGTGLATGEGERAGPVSDAATGERDPGRG